VPRNIIIVMGLVGDRWFSRVERTICARLIIERGTKMTRVDMRWRPLHELGNSRRHNRNIDVKILTRARVRHSVKTGVCFNWDYTKAIYILYICSVRRLEIGGSRGVIVLYRPQTSCSTTRSPKTQD